MNQKLFIANTSEKKKFFEKDWYFCCQICFRSSDYQHLSCFNSLMSCLENMSFINHLTTLHYRALVISNAVTTFMGRKDIISGNNVSVSAPHILIADSAGSQGFCGSLLDLHLCFHRLQTSHRRAGCELHPNSWSAWWRDSLPLLIRRWLWLCHQPHKDLLLPACRCTASLGKISPFITMKVGFRMHIYIRIYKYSHISYRC